MYINININLFYNINKDIVSIYYLYPSSIKYRYIDIKSTLTLINKYKISTIYTAKSL